MNKQDELLVENAVKQAMRQQSNFGPPQPQQQQLNITPVLSMASCGIISPKQAWYWIFRGIEPTEFWQDGVGDGEKSAVSLEVSTHE